MSPIRSFKVLPVCLAVAALTTLAQSAHAQTVDASAAPKANAATRAQNAAEENTLNAVVITGTAKHSGQQKLATSFSISTASEEQIKEAAPSSTADLLKIVPGLFIESSGGTAGANIEVRGFPTGGDAPYVTMQLDGVPMFPASTLSFMENSSLFRLDNTIERVEVLRGGPSPIWSNGQAGATANFIQKRGGDVPEGSIGYTAGNGGLQRFDLYYGGKLADKWYISGGGFYRTSTGIRDTQYPADEGGQLSINLTRKLDDGELSLWGRVTREKNTFFTGIPLVSTDNGNSINAYPGLDALTGALQGNGFRNVTIETSPGSTPGQMPIDLADGRGLSSQMFGLDFNQKVGQWTFSDKAGYMSGQVPTKALFTGGTPVRLGDYISGKVGSANGSPTVLAAAGGTAATGGTARSLDGTVLTDMNQQVLSAGIWSVDKDVRAFTNDARINREFDNGHTLSMGMYLASYASHDLWYLGNSMLMTAQNHAQPVNVALNNGVQVTRNGFDGASFYALDATYNGQNTAFTLADEWKVNKQVRLDGGVRWERETITGSVGQPNSGDLDGNPLTLYNNNASYLSGNYKPIDFSADKLSYTVGAAYMVNDNLNTFVRANAGLRFPNFDDLRDGARSIEDVKQYEVGVKAADKNYSFFVTGFYNTFQGQPQSQILANGTILNFLLGSKAYGLEFEGMVRPVKNFEITLGGNYAKAEYVDSGTFTGNQVQRQPKVQLRLTPSYRFNTDWGTTKVFATYAYTGERFGDVQNQQPLPAYATLDAGVVANIDDLELRLTGTNLTNTIGVTEGNARVVGSGSNAQGVFIGRPIFGRGIQVSITKHF